MAVVPYRPTFSYTIPLNASSNTSARTTPVGTSTIRVTATTPCWLSYNAPAVQGQGVLIPAGHVEYFHCAQGDIFSAIADSGTGMLSITEVSR